ncbi:MAG: hypothetical protein LBI12_06955 [Treponema sp.]|jgi:hypothetical protein|nr:hypothetical protein [Treponema sp.]
MMNILPALKNAVKTVTVKCLFLPLVLAGFGCLYPLYGNDAPRPPINVNLIIDGSAAFLEVKDEVTGWVNNRFDQILSDGDRVTIWNAGSSARVIYSGVISSNADRENAKKSISDFSAAGNIADFSGALRDAASRQSSTFSYTLLISASPDALSSVLSSPQANLLRFSRVDEFNTWRALVIGLNLDTRVKRAAAAFFGS